VNPRPQGTPDAEGRVLPAIEASHADTPRASERAVRGRRSATSHSALRERLLDVNEAAAMLGVQPATLYKWAHERRLPVVKLFGPRGALRFRLTDLQRLIATSLRQAIRASED
jgi:excisionase family DNA binding protein